MTLHALGCSPYDALVEVQLGLARPTIEMLSERLEKLKILEPIQIYNVKIEENLDVY